MASTLVTRLHLLKEVGVSRNIIIFYQNELLNLGFKEIGGQDIRNVRADVCDIIQPAIFNKFIDVLEKVITQIQKLKNIPPVEQAIQEAHKSTPDAFRYKQLPKRLIATEQRIITKDSEIISVDSFDDVIALVGEEPLEVDDRWIQSELGIEACAFYMSFHYSPNWGIYVKKDCLRHLSAWLKDSINGTWRDCVEFVWYTLLYHEKYHYKIDLFSLMIESSKKYPLYIHYFNDVYSKTFLSSDNLEEALANAFAVRSIRFVPTKKDYDAKKEWLQDEWFDNTPGGYRDYVNYLSTSDFRYGENRIMAQIIDGKINTNNDYSHLADFIIGSGHKFWRDVNNRVFLVSK